MSRILVFDRNGNALAELEATCERSWLLSDVGKATFSLSTQDKKCRREFLQFGNLVYIEHEKLPVWAGVIDVPRKWESGKVTVTAYSGEKLLSYRIGPLNRTLRGSTKTVLKTIMELAQQEEPLPMVIGDFQESGRFHEETVNLTNLFELFQKIVEQAGGDFFTVPEISEQKLRFVLSYYSGAIGMETGFGLIEGHNLELSGRPLTEQGTICNDLVGYSNGASWASKVTERVIDEESIAQYGRRQDGKSFGGDSEAGTLKENTKKTAAVSAQPKQTLDLNALDVGDTWNWLRLGNSFEAQLHTVGFYGDGFGYRGTIVVHGMEFNEDKQTVRIICEGDEE
jgi:hypothetical protein